MTIVYSSSLDHVGEGEQLRVELRSQLQHGLLGPEERNGTIRQRAKSVCGVCSGGRGWDVTFSVLKRAKESSGSPRLRKPSLTDVTKELVLGGGSATCEARSLKSGPVDRAEA